MKRKKKITTRFDTHISRAELTEEIPPDKFDHHMKKARKDDLRSRRKIFVAQSCADDYRNQKTDALTSSVY